MTKNTVQNYDSLDRPYNTYLQRTSPNEIAISGLPNDNNPGEQKPVKSGNFLDDIFLNTWIKSSFYKPHRQGFYLDGRNSYVEINGQLVIGGGDIGTGISMSSNDIFLFDNSIGGVDPVTGNTSSILFVNSGDADPLNPVLSKQPRTVIQKRKGVNNNNENVLEIFYDQRALPTGKNYIFIGRPGGVKNTSTNINDYSTNIVQAGVSDMFGVSIYSTITGAKNLGIALYNKNYSSSMNDEGSRLLITTFKSNPADAMTPANIIGGTWAGGGVVFQEQESAGGSFILGLDAGSIISGVNVLPIVNQTYDLGSSSYNWNNLYIKTINLNGNLVFAPSINTSILMSKGAIGFMSIANGGNNYSLGDIVDVVGGGSSSGGKAEVLTIGAGGVVTFVAVSGTGGEGYTVSNALNTSYGGAGTGLTVNITSLSGQRTYNQEKITYKDGSGNNQTKWFLTGV